MIKFLTRMNAFWLILSLAFLALPSCTKTDEEEMEGTETGPDPVLFVHESKTSLTPSEVVELGFAKTVTGIVGTECDNWSYPPNTEWVSFPPPKKKYMASKNHKMSTCITEFDGQPPVAWITWTYEIQNWWERYKKPAGTAKEPVNFHVALYDALGVRLQSIDMGQTIHSCGSYTRHGHRESFEAKYHDSIKKIGMAHGTGLMHPC